MAGDVHAGFACQHAARVFAAGVAVGAAEHARDFGDARFVVQRGNAGLGFFAVAVFFDAVVTDKIFGASAAFTFLENKDKKQSLEWALDYQHHAHFGEFAATSIDYTLGAQKFRAGWEMLDYKKEKFWQQYHLGYRYNLSKRTYTEAKVAYRTQGGEHDYLGKILLRHEF